MPWQRWNAHALAVLYAPPLPAKRKPTSAAGKWAIKGVGWRTQTDLLTCLAPSQQVDTSQAGHNSPYHPSYVYTYARCLV
jgi:hypothetical protein